MPNARVANIDVGTFDEQGNHHSYDGNHATGNSARKIWYTHGVMHRDGDLPAIIEEKKESKTWVVEGLVHRDGDKPAYMSGEYTQWYVMGLNHRVNGPARICERKEEADNQEWFLYGIKVSESQHSYIFKKAAELKLPAWAIFLHEIGLLNDDFIKTLPEFMTSNKTLPAMWVLKMHNIDEEKLQKLYIKNSDLPRILDTESYLKRFLSLINYEALQ